MENQVNIDSDINQRIDELEFEMLSNYPTVDCPLTHRFVPGMYIREIYMPAGSIITSLIHKIEHPYFILKGRALVKVKEGEWERLSAPYIGITYPDTRRVLYIEEDCIWATVHKTDIKPKDDSEESILEAVNLICEEIIEKHENKLLGGVLKNNVLKINFTNNILK